MEIKKCRNIYIFKLKNSSLREKSLLYIYIKENENLKVIQDYLAPHEVLILIQKSFF